MQEDKISPQELLPHAYPFLLVDSVLNYSFGEIMTKKNVTIDEPFFQGHFPQKPIMPGVLLIEFAAQSIGIMLILDRAATSGSETGVAKDAGVLASVNDIRFKRKVVPGDSLYVLGKLMTRNDFFVKGSFEIKNQDEQLVCSGNLVISVSGT